MCEVKVGVVGVGVMGQRHCRVYSNLRGVQLAGVCDTVPEMGAKVAQQYQTPFYSDIDELLDRVDAVSLTVPTPFHFDLAKYCLDRRVHILIEKPLAETLEQAEMLTRMAEASDLIVQVGHIERFNPVYIELRNVLESMTVLAINMRRMSPYRGSNTDVDVILDLMIHDLDLALDLIAQEPGAVNAYGFTALNGAIDHAMAHLDFESGPFLTITASRITEQKIRSIEIAAQNAYLEADLLNKSIAVHRSTIGEYLSHQQQGVKYRQESIIERIHVPTFEPLLLELQHFTDCILTNKPPLVSVRDGFRAMRLAAAIRDTIRDRLINATARPTTKLIQNKSIVPFWSTG